MAEKFICNDLYKHLIDRKYYDQILFLSNEECDKNAGDRDLSGIEGCILQPFYINKSFLDRMPNLKFAQATSAGYDRVDTDELRRRGITLLNTRGVMSISIAEDVFSKILFFSRRIRHVEEMKKKHQWDMFGQDQWMCTCYDDLYGRNIGIMGYGSIGREIAKRAEAFGMHVLVYDIVKPDDKRIRAYFPAAELDKFYGSCDFLVVSLPLLDATRHIIDVSVFQKMKPSAVLINVARGPLVNTEDLITALNSGEIAGAAIDVYEEEPLPADSPLWDTEHLFMSSHKAGMGDTWKGFIGALIMRNIDHYLRGEKLENIIRLQEDNS